MEHESELKLFFWVGTAIMLGLTFLILLLTVIYQKKVHQLKQKEAESLLKVSLLTEKKERKRIASDLHDGVIGDLNAIRNYVTVLSNQLEKESSSSAVLLKEVTQALTTMQESIKCISYNLMPPMLDDSGFLVAIDEYFKKLEKWNALSITSHYSPEHLVIPNFVAYELYRVVQELISNMLKYGKVENVYFSIIYQEGSYTISITDNGIPFNFYESLHNSSGMGLKSIISRLKQFDANLTQEQIDSGNKLIITFKENTHVTDSHS